MSEAGHPVGVDELYPDLVISVLGYSFNSVEPTSQHEVVSNFDKAEWDTVNSHFGSFRRVLLYAQFLTRKKEKHQVSDVSL